MRRLEFALEAVRLQKAQIAEALGEAIEAQCQATASAQELKDKTKNFTHKWAYGILPFPKKWY